MGRGGEDVLTYYTPRCALTYYIPRRRGGVGVRSVACGVMYLPATPRGG